MAGPEEHQRRYRDLARMAEAELWRLWAADDIAFANIPGSSRDEFGAASPEPYSADIRISRQFEPSRDPAEYATPREQANLCATACTLAHEAVHLVTATLPTLEQELMCRHLQALFFQDLLTPRMYGSRLTGSPCTAQLTPSTPALENYIRDQQRRVQAMENNQMIDYIMGVRVYRGWLTADFIIRSRDWWGGPANRRPLTRGIYLNALAADERGRNEHGLILDLLSGFRTALEWQEARTVLVDLGPLRNALRTVGAGIQSRLGAIETAIGEQLH